MKLDKMDLENLHKFLRETDVDISSVRLLTKRIHEFCGGTKNLQEYHFQNLLVLSKMERIENSCIIWEGYINSLCNEFLPLNEKTLSLLRTLKGHEISAFCTHKIFGRRLAVIKRILQERRRAVQTTVTNMHEFEGATERQLSSPIYGDLQQDFSFSQSSNDGEDRAGITPRNVIPNMLGEGAWSNGDKN